LLEFCQIQHLDEIGEWPLETQPKLLRFLNSKEIHPLGEATPRRVAVRIMAATHADPERMMREGRFREDLYHRLNMVHVGVPHARSVLQNRDLSPTCFEGRETPPPVTSDDARALSVRVDRPLSEIAQDVEIAALIYAMRATNGRMDLAARRDTATSRS
jgi:transcriptional regulator of acetoin/glycerol metabolism